MRVPGVPAPMDDDERVLQAVFVDSDVDFAANRILEKYQYIREFRNLKVDLEHSDVRIL